MLLLRCSRRVGHLLAWSGVAPARGCFGSAASPMTWPVGAAGWWAVKEEGSGARSMALIVLPIFDVGGNNQSS